MSIFALKSLLNIDVNLQTLLRMFFRFKSQL